MGYDAALSKGWSELARVAQEKNYTLRFLSDNYRVDLENRRVLSSSGNTAKIPYAILILHYLVQKLKGLPPAKGAWFSFKELAGGQAYYPVFKKRVIEVILKKYKDNPEGLLSLNKAFKARPALEAADLSIILDAFDQVPVLISFWRGDREFGPEANVLFDKNIANIFCTEDIVVLAEILAHSI